MWDNYEEIGIDHFATKSDGLSRAKKAGTLRRNFQGYTDDTSDVLIGVGASSISRFPQGYAQNAPATSAHTGAIRDGRFSTARGHVFSDDDKLRARMIEALMCDFRIDLADITNRFGTSQSQVMQMLDGVATQFPDMVHVDETGLFVPPKARALTRMMARSLDAYDLDKAGHSSAI